ncbi:MAG TPA: hypothetical protein VG604_04320 [Candidatus Saccharimonadales bacterium]|nr:hypothetical protein [Candidatus Saccharimonadales bacterium]
MPTPVELEREAQKKKEEAELARRKAEELERQATSRRNEEQAALKKAADAAGEKLL